jgi:hypothetical protein
MESLGYVLLYFLRGALPWQGLKAETKEQKEKLILERKQSADDGELFTGLPAEFEKYFKHIRSLSSKNKPNYTYLSRLFRNLFLRNDFVYDYVFDWTELKFLEFLERKKDHDQHL